MSVITKDAKGKTYLNLLWWFNRDTRLALPFVALPMQNKGFGYISDVEILDCEDTDIPSWLLHIAINNPLQELSYPHYNQNLLDLTFMPVE